MKHPSQFDMHRNTQGQVVFVREKRTKQDFYNGFAAVVGTALPWAAFAFIAWCYITGVCK